MSIPPPSDNYLGEPDWPSPWTTPRPREGLRDTDAARIVSLAPDVCKTPVGSSTPPIPYPVVDYCGHDENYTPSVRFTQQKAMVMRSNTTHVHGDAPGTAGGVKSGTVGKRCHPIEHADAVRAEGSCVIRHLDQFWMNDRNTKGEAVFVRNTETFSTPEDDDPIPGSLRWSGPDEGRVMSDASPEPLIMGAQYAQAQPVQQARSGGAVRAQPRQQPRPQPQPRQNPAPGRQPFRQLPPAANDNVFQRRGTFARPVPSGASRVFGILGMAQAGAQAGDMAGRWYVGQEGVLGRAIGDHQRAQVPVGSPQAGVIYDLPWHLGELFRGGSPTIMNTNDLLSLKAGVPLDFRNMDPDDLANLLEAPWPNAEALRRNGQRIGERRAPVAVPVPQNVRVEREREKQRCRVDTYEKMEPICRAVGMQAHHIVPDWTLRWGTRAEGMTGQKRIRTMPSFWNGQSICVEGNARSSGTEHNEAHFADAAIEAIGAGSNPAYTASLEDVKRESIIAMTAVRPHCEAQILAAVNSEFAASDASQLLRARQRVQDIPDATMRVLSNGQFRGR